MAQVYSPTPHRVSLCALARYLVHSHARDTAAAERMGVSPEEVMWWLDRPSRRRVDVTTGEPLGPVLLGPADARRLAAVLMYEASRSDGFREPDLRTFTASLSTHHVAVRPYHDEDELDDELDDPMAAHVDHPDELTEVIHETFADLLRDAVNSIRGVDSIARLFHEVAPRSKHESEMRGLNDDDPEREYQPDPFPEGPGAAEEGSALGVFLRRCVADFERLTFEGSVSVFGRFASYVAEGAGVYDDLDQAKMRDEADAASNRLRVDQRQADAEVIGRVDDSDDDDDDVLLRRLGALHGSHLGPLVLDNRQFAPDSTLSANSLTQITDGLSDASVRLPSMLHAWVARRVRGVDQRGGYESCVEVERSLDEMARVAPRLPGAELARHLAHVSNRDFASAMEHTRRHFDYLPDESGPGGGDGSYSNGTSVSLDVGAGASFGLPVNPRQAAERGREIPLLDPSGLNDSNAGTSTLGSQQPTQEQADAAAAAQRARLQSALLTLGVAHFQFSHGREALKSLNEAVRTAQQNGDEASLAHALAAFTALCASTSGSLASTEGSPAVDEWVGDESDGLVAGVGARGGAGGYQAADDSRLLLRRLTRQAHTLRIPHLMAYGELASARHRASRPPCGPAPWGRKLDGDVDKGKVPSSTHADKTTTASIADTAAAFARVSDSPPATVTAATQRVESLRHAVSLGAAAPQTAAAAAAAAAGQRENAGNAVNAHDLFPPPKGLSLAPASTAHGSEAAMETLSGASSVLSSAVWDAHGCPTMARMHALRHVRCDSTRINHSSRKNSPGYKLDDSYNTPASLEDADAADGAAAAAGDTATALAQLARHASTHHGPDAAADVFAAAASRFRNGNFLATKPALASAAAATAHDTARARGDGDACDVAARRLASLAPASERVDPESGVEARRARADAALLSGRVGDANAIASISFARAQGEGLTHAALRATLTLAESHLAAGAPACALQHALALEHSASALRLDGLRAAVGFFLFPYFLQID